MSRKGPAAAPVFTAWMRLAMVAITLVVATGCNEEQGISQYSVPPTVEFVDPDYAWYIKLSGSPEVVETLSSRFQEFVASMDVGKTEDGAPIWNLPEDWTVSEATDG